MRAWDWKGDAAPYVDALPVFGPRDDDQPLPELVVVTGDVGRDRVTTRSD
jgi:hypothetical protein